MADIRRLSLFPLGGALLLPRAYLPLHIFEPRYRAMVEDSLVRERRIGMIQPRDPADPDRLYDIGCIGKIIDVQALEDGRYNLVLEGVSRFRLVQLLDRPTAFLQIEASTDGFEEDGDEPDPLAAVIRAAIERDARRMAAARGYEIDWDQVARLDDEGLVNGIAQVAPFDIAAKQALLEAEGLPARADLLLQLLSFMAPDAEDPTLQ
ncbi:LON peptidase substrate-binding domain-containing protein [Sphingomonas naphthae]|uniref:LON peptidase substrate-binding domain-containing protein n=1 Tax=Sphingomonas naphthae TaxID=1813468 RepID=A0ABY7TJA0_9SPHN|nr:LON peptidase substrate-binding domain-containing protein [Sphingomonas naphthae]WCT73306.1 LON peptidase substrate-binding domain-containing protein [Sphingomonas naphthae]